ncbi:MAG: enoyl-CoA hydratase/isomerase family protein [Pirellulaceae bacterium]
MEPLVKLKKHAPSGTIILNRPAKCNALTRPMLSELLQAFEDFHLERQVRAVILTGAGEAFCAGADLAEIRETSQTEDAQQQWYHDAVQYKDLVEFMLRFPKPIVAAVNGAAVAGGAGLVLASDIVVAASDASFGFPDARRGLVSGLAAPLLVFRAGAGVAAKLLLSAATLDAEQAHRANLFHEVVRNELVWARSHEIAMECAQSAPEALQLTKRLLNETIGEHLGISLAAGAAASATARTTQAATEGVAAFLERREPEWK